METLKLRLQKPCIPQEAYSYVVDSVNKGLNYTKLECKLRITNKKHYVSEVQHI